MAEAVPAGVPAEAPPGWVERVFGTRRFFALFNVQVISALGDWVGFFAITALAASISSQPEAAIALVTTARVLPGILLAPFIGVLVDRFDRKKLMITADLMRAVVFLCLPLVRTVPGLVFASLILEVFTMMWSPAKEATVPQVVPTEKLTTANSLSLVAAYATMPVAGPIQFALKQFGDPDAATQTLPFYFDALSFVASAFILWRFVFRGMPSTSVRARREQAEAAAAAEGREPERDPVAEERSFLQRTVGEIREGWEFIFVNPVVRAVMIGLATGLVGGAMLVPLGPTFARYVIGQPDTFSLFITALGFGVAVGVMALGALQRRLPKEKIFPVLVFMAGVSLFFGVSMSTFWLAAAGVFGLGLCAGAVYVLGFTLLQEYTDDELRGRVFTTLLTLVRICVLLALLLGPFLATVFNGFARAATGADGDEVPTASLFGFDLAVPGVRLTLWLAAVIIMVAGVLSAQSMRSGLRERLRLALSSNAASSAAKDRHPTTFPPSGDAPGTPTDPAAGPPVGTVGGPTSGASSPASPGLPPPGEVTSEIAPLDLPASLRPRGNPPVGGPDRPPLPLEVPPTDPTDDSPGQAGQAGAAEGDGA